MQSIVVLLHKPNLWANTQNKYLFYVPLCQDFINNKQHMPDKQLYKTVSDILWRLYKGKRNKDNKWND